MSRKISLWRCFPWDDDAAPGTPFAPDYLSPGQTVGRFDLGDRPPVRYLAGSEVHAIGEILAEFRGTRFHPSYLRRQHRPLALVRILVTTALLARVPDCTEPAELDRLGLRPDSLAHHDRQVTQGIARKLHNAGHAGLRWWSAITGAWHTTVIFTDRVRARQISFGKPEILDAGHPALREALRVVGVR